jgi:hypothetical protein
LPHGIPGGVKVVLGSPKYKGLKKSHRWLMLSFVLGLLVLLLRASARLNHPVLLAFSVIFFVAKIVS